MGLVKEALKNEAVPASIRQIALDRSHADPGIPSSKRTTKSFWLKTPHPSISHAQSAKLAESADIVIIGSGISGTSLAYFLLKALGKQQKNVRLVMLEAREACSGATGRNGGHIIPDYSDYTELKSMLGQAEAQRIIRLRRNHVPKLLAVAEELGCKTECQGREVEGVAVFHEEEDFRLAAGAWANFQKEMPCEASGSRIIDSEQTKKEFGYPYAKGIIAFPAGAIWPYKLVTNILEHIRNTYAENFELETSTSVHEIRELTDQSEYSFGVSTNRGVIRAKHVIHCTNAHVGSLIPEFRGVVVPLRGQMSAQTPGQKFGSQGSKHSWIFQYAQGFDYLTQLTESSDSAGEMMFGGGINPFTKAGIDDIGVATDDELNPYVDIHLSGGLRAVFGSSNWGEVPGAQVRSMWSGTIGMSMDNFPWVGELSSSITGRAVSPHGGSEWVCAGFSGEGMVHAWSCGEALAEMVVSRIRPDFEYQESSMWFPRTFLVSKDRLDRAKLELSLVELEKGEEVCLASPP